MSDRIRIDCPQCESALAVRSSRIGQSANCPSCSCTFDIPSDVELSAQQTILDDELEPTVTYYLSENPDDERDRLPGADSDSAFGNVGRFELREILGEGAFGRVYRAFDPVLSRQVALKVPKFESKDERKTRRFLTEASAAARLRHPNIVAVYESGCEGGQYFIVSEFVSGETLSQFIANDRPNYARAADLIRALASALAYAHDEGIVHRDIKPGNIMLGARQRVQIMDFGLAKRLDVDSTLTAEGSIVGTPAYMPPEQARGETDTVGPLSDQYSLGVVFYVLLTGQKPYDGPAHTVLAQVADGSLEPPALRAIDPQIPRDLAAICQKAMRKDPTQRYQSLSGMSEDLAAWMRGDVTIARPVSRLGLISRWCRRNPVVAALTASVVVLLISVAAVLGIAYSRETDLRQQADFERTAANNQKRIALVETAKASSAQRKAEVLLTETELARRDLATALEDLKLARQQEAAAQELARRKQELADETSKTIKSRTDADVRLSKEYLRIGHSRLKQGLANHAVLWMARALEVAPNGDENLERSIRFAMSESRARLHRLVAFRPGDFGNSQIRVTRTHVIVSGDNSVERFAHKDITMPGKDQHIAALHGRNIADFEQRYASELRKRKLSPDGTRLIVVEPPKKKDRRKGTRNIVIYDLRTKPPSESRIAHRQGVRAFTMSRDNRYLAVLGATGTTTIWDLQTKKRSHQLKASGPTPPQSNDQTIEFDSSGSKLILGGRGGVAGVWDVKTGKNIDLFTPYSTVERTCASVDGRYVAFTTESRYDGIRLAVWHMSPRSTKYHRRAQIKLQRSVKSIALSANGTMVAVAYKTAADMPGEIEIRDSKHLRKIGHSLSLAKAAGSVSFGPDNRLLVSTNGEGIRVWELMKLGQLPWSVVMRDENERPAFIQGMDISPNGDSFATYSGTIVRFWDVATGKSRGKPLVHSLGIQLMRYSPSGRHVVTSNGSEALVWDLKTGSQIGQPVSVSSDRKACEFSSDGKYLLARSFRQFIRLDLETGKHVKTSHGESPIGSKPTFSPDGKLLLSFETPIKGRFPAVFVHEVENPLKKLWRLPFSQRTNSFKGVFTSDGKIVIMTNTGQFPRTRTQLDVHDARTGTTLGESITVDGTATLLGVSDKFSFVIVNSNSRTAPGVRLWNYMTGEEIRKARIAGPENTIYGTAQAKFSRDHSKLIVFPKNNSLASRRMNRAFLIDAKTGTLIGKPLELAAHGKTNSFAFTADAKKVLTTSNHFQAWNAETGAPIWQFESTRARSFAAVSARGQHVLISNGSRIVMHDVSTGLQEYGDRASYRIPLATRRFPVKFRKIKFSSNGRLAIADDSLCNIRDQQKPKKIPLPTGIHGKIWYTHRYSLTKNGRYCVAVTVGARKPRQKMKNEPRLSLIDRSIRQQDKTEPRFRNRIVVTVLDTRTAQQHGKSIRRPLPKTHSTIVAAASPDGMNLAIVDGSQLEFWDSTNGLLRIKTALPSKTVRIVQFADNGTRLLVAGDSQTCLVDPATRTFVGKPWRTPSAEFVDFGPDARLVLVASKHTVRVRDIKTGVDLGELTKFDDDILDAKFTSDGKQFMTLTKFTVRYWNSRTLKPLGEIPLQMAGIPLALGMSAAGETVIVRHDDPRVDDEVTTWKLQKPRREPRSTLIRSAMLATGMRLDSKGELRMIDARIWAAARTSVGKSTEPGKPNSRSKSSP